MPQWVNKVKAQVLLDSNSAICYTAGYTKDEGVL